MCAEVAERTVPETNKKEGGAGGFGTIPGTGRWADCGLRRALSRGSAFTSLLLPFVLEYAKYLSPVRVRRLACWCIDSGGAFHGVSREFRSTLTLALDECNRSDLSYGVGGHTVGWQGPGAGFVLASERSDLGVECQLTFW